jgi:hypothetical protein
VPVKFINCKKLLLCIIAGISDSSSDHGIILLLYKAVVVFSVASASGKG